MEVEQMQAVHEEDEHDEHDAGGLLSTMTGAELASFFLRPSVSFHVALAGGKTLWSYWRSYRRSRATTPQAQEEENKRRAAQFLQDSHYSRMEASCSKRVGVAAAVVVAGIALMYVLLLVLYTRFHPSVPLLDVVNATINHLTTVDNGGPWNVSASFTVSISNENKRLDLHSDYVEVSASCYGVPLGSERTPAFVQPRRSTRTVEVKLVQPNIDVPMLQRYNVDRDAGAGSLAMLLHITLKARMSTLPGVKSPIVWSREKCKLQIADGNYILQKSCALE